MSSHRVSGTRGDNPVTDIAASRTGVFDRLPEPIWSDRLVLRAPSAQDIPAMARLANNPEVHKWLARLPHPYSRDDAATFIGTIARSEIEHAWSILNRDGDFLGTIGLHILNQPAELGYWLGEPYWGQGYASEAVSALVSALDAAGIERTAARAKAENTASRRVLEKAGFVLDDERVGDCGPDKDRLIAWYSRERVT